MIALVAIAALTPMAVVTPQDQSRLCLSEALLDLRVSNDPCLAPVFDKATYHGHLYSDKAPGFSLLALPAVALLRPGPPSRWIGNDLRLWGVRVLTVGLAFLLCAFMVGRVTEGLAPGYGGIALVTFALGTLVAPFAAVGYEHVVAAALGFAAFLLAWGRRPALAGFVAALALLVEYQCGLLLIAIGVYIALQGWGALVRFAAGAIPATALLAAYDWAAFGAPWRLSYRYIANPLEGEQTTGFFGIGPPHLVGIVEVLTGSRGLIVLSPVLVLASVGLVRLGWQYRAEAVLASGVTVLFLLVNFGYFDPYGGSQGPRFAIVALPFLALGLGPAFEWAPRMTSLAGALSVAITTMLTLIWSKVYYPGAVAGVSGGPLGELVRLPGRLGTSRLASELSPNALGFAGLGPGAGAVVVALATTGAVCIGLIPAFHRSRGARTRPPARAVAGVVVLAYLVLAADVLALANYPYGANPQIELVRLRTSLSPSQASSYLGGEVNFTASVVDRGTVGADNLFLTIELSPGLGLVGPPAYTRGNGCKGASTIVCDLGFLRPKGEQEATVSFGVQIRQGGNQLVRVFSGAVSDPRSNVVSAPIAVPG